MSQDEIEVEFVLTATVDGELVYRTSSQMAEIISQSIPNAQDAVIRRLENE